MFQQSVQKFGHVTGHQENRLVLKMIFPTWFHHQEEHFSCKEVQFKSVCPPIYTNYIWNSQDFHASAWNEPCLFSLLYANLFDTVNLKPHLTCSLCIFLAICAGICIL